ncbi:conserved hypothetical protein [Culex quinquefasciatus]|uniref:Uncharacterized protein n=1 Tax=Culex quinquefasciatus TaxID=7176 RepID=B0W4I2_CULQU|nr:conserved hypothetical protein [Culex quinquefasciatus]|eukprot:XP_001843616.1 conserved hypothetical protein [Culex quinquefasciatus]
MEQFLSCHYSRILKSATERSSRYRHYNHVWKTSSAGWGSKCWPRSNVKV